MSQALDTVNAWMASIKSSRLSKVIYGLSWIGAPHGFVPWDTDGDLCESMVDIEFELESGTSVFLAALYSIEGHFAVPGKGLEFSVWEGMQRSEHDHDVSNTSRWTNLVGRAVVDVDVYWAPEWYVGHEAERWTPTEVELTFESGDRILITWSRAARRSGLPATIDEDLYVIFDEWVKRRYGLGPYHQAQKLG